MKYRKSAISSTGRSFISNTFERWGGGGGGVLFNLEKEMVLFLHKELEYNVEELKYKVGGHTTENQNQIWTSSW